MLLRDIQAESLALDLLMILLWLFCAGVTGQEPCSSPGDFPSPKLYLSTSSAQVGDSILAQCSVHPYIVAALVIFCKDGKEISSQKAMPDRLLYQYDISVRSSGQFRCMYQYRNDQNQVKNSRLSLPRILDVPGGRLRPEAIWGIAGLSVLCLAPLIYLLVKKVTSKRRCPSEPFPNHSSENTPTEEQIQYAAISEFRAATIPRVQENETATYAIVGKVHDRPS